MPLVTPELIAQRLSARTRLVQPGRGRAASVLIPFLARGDEVHLLFTRRTERMRTHKGQYAFPGGARDPGDAGPVETALREAREEVGIAPGDVRVLGLLDDVVTFSGYVVTPVVGWIPHPYGYTPHEAEVALVVELPFASFIEPPRARTLLGEGFRRLVLAFDVEGHFIWGATAGIVRALVDALGPLTAADARGVIPTPGGMR